MRVWTSQALPGKLLLSKRECKRESVNRKITTTKIYSFYAYFSLRAEKLMGDRSSPGSQPRPLFMSTPGNAKVTERLSDLGYLE